VRPPSSLDAGSESGAGMPEDLWRDDVALELWVWEGNDPVRVLVSGAVNPATAPSLVGLLDQELAAGHARFEVWVDAHGGADPDVMAALELQVAAAGGRLVWCDPPRN
jgi:hypothetical protein